VKHFADDKHYFELPGYNLSNGSGTQYDFEESGFRRVWQGFCSALSSSWWTRLWCVQEALLSDEALVVFGRWSMSWDRLGLAIQRQHRHQLSCCADTAKLMASRFIFQVDPLVTEHRSATNVEGEHDTPNKYNLDLILRAYRHKHCQDPRDKVYGLLGLVGKHNLHKLLPDYSLPLQDVLINTMEAVILESRGDLRCFTGSGFTSQREGVPSWVRDVACKPNTSMIFPESQRVETYALYNAAKNTVAKVVQRSRTQVALTGFPIDRVSKAGKAVQTRDIDHVNDVFNEWRHIVGLHDRSSTSIPSSNREKAFWRTVIGDALSDVNGEWKRLGPSELKAYEQWMSDFPSFTTSRTQYSLHRTFLHAMRAAICGRSVLVTHSGKIGLCEPKAEAGDEVWVLHGGRVPFLLRPVFQQESNGPAQYALVGACYITGVMDGEAFVGRSPIAHEILLV
jgi:hypothetical protein